MAEKVAEWIKPADAVRFGSSHAVRENRYCAEKGKRAGMLFVWLVFGIELCVTGIAKFAIGPSALITPLVIGLHVTFMLAYIVHLPRYLVPPLAAAFAVRGAAAIYDCATLELTWLNGDAFGYYDTAVRMATGRQLVPGQHGGTYSRLLSLVFRCTGPSRGMGEYVNILLGMTTVWLLYLTLRTVGASIRTQKRFLWLIALFPYTIVNSCITHREGAICTFVAASAYFALRWYKKRQTRFMICCIIYVLFAAACHAGVIMMSIGYAVLFVMYSHKEKRYVVNRHTVPIVLLVTVLAVAVVFVFPDVFLTKLQGATDAEYLVRYANRRGGNSVYLESLMVQSVWGVILTAPIRMFYSLFAPLPWDFRNIKDAAVFFVDSMVYMFFMVYVCRHYRHSAYKNLLSALALGWLLTAIAFAFGAVNAGTTVRHRNKIFAVLLMMAAMAGQKAPKPGGADRKAG